MAESICQLCEQPIGYEEWFNQDPDAAGQYVHADCLESAVTNSLPLGAF